MVVELLVMGGIGLAVGGWLLSRRGQPSSDAGIDPVFAPYGSGPSGCTVTPDEREGAVASDPRAGDATCGIQDGDGDGDTDCGGSDGSDGGSDGGGDSSSD